MREDESPGDFSEASVENGLGPSALDRWPNLPKALKEHGGGARDSRPTFCSAVKITSPGMELDKLGGEKLSLGGSFAQMNAPIEETDEGEHTSQKETTDQEPTVGEENFLHRLGCTLPPSGFAARYLTRGLIVVVSWAVLWSIIGHDALPGGNIFGIFMVITCACFGGFLVRCIPCIDVPPLLGMLVAGFMLNNVPHIDVARAIDKKWSSTLRSMALVVILIRSGLGLNTDALRRLKFTCVCLAFVPCIAEAVTASVIVHFALGIKWLWAFQLG